MTAAVKAAPSTLTHWLIWGALVAACWGGAVALILIEPPLYLAFANPPFWFTLLQFSVMPAIGILASIAPLAALVTMFAKIGRVALFWIMGFCALMQFGFLGLQYYVASQPPAPPGIERWSAP